MKDNCCRCVLYLLIVLILISCGEKNDPEVIRLSGTVYGQGVDEYPDKPILVGVLRHNNDAPFDLSSLDNLVKLVSVDKNDFSFQCDLTSTDLGPGDEINLIAFVDVDFSGGIPSPDSGDFIGVRVDGETFSVAYELKRGINSGLHININRMVLPYKAEISGNVMESPAGELTIIAYAGEINKLDFSEVDPDEIIAYTRIEKGPELLAYHLDILPCPRDLDLEHVYILAFLDENGSGIPAPGNIVGFHMDQSGTIPELIRIDTTTDVHLSQADIHMRFADTSSEGGSEIRIPESSGDTIILKGEFVPPSDFNPDEGALFVLAARVGTPYELMDTPLTLVRYFQKMPKGETVFSLDLSHTGLTLTDEVMVAALWDRDYTAGFPKPTPGDMVGYLQQKDLFNYSIMLSRWQDVDELPEGWEFSLNRRIYDHQATVLFDIDTADPVTLQAGDPIIAIAVSENGINLLDRTIDMDYIVGIKEVIIGREVPPYTIRILPALYTDVDLISDPFTLYDVYFIAVIDNSPFNDLPDSGEYFGYYGARIPFTQEYIPLAADIEDSINSLEMAIRFTGDTF